MGLEEASWPGTPVRVKGKAASLRSGRAGGLENAVCSSLGDDGQRGTLGVTCAWVPVRTAAAAGSGKWAAGA